MSQWRLFCYSEYPPHTRHFCVIYIEDQYAMNIVNPNLFAVPLVYLLFSLHTPTIRTTCVGVRVFFGITSEKSEEERW